MLTASRKGIGAVLMQEGRPVAYYVSQTLSDNCPGYPKVETLFIGKTFQGTLRQKSSRFLTEQKIMGEDKQKWTSN